MSNEPLPLQLTEESCASLKNIYLKTDMGPLDGLGAILGLGDFQTVK